MRRQRSSLTQAGRLLKPRTAKGKRFPLKATCLSIYSRVVNAQAALATVLARQFPWCTGWERELKDLFAAYVEAKQPQNVLDYDDLLLYWAEMMAHRAIAAAVADRFDHVLVDEYQDTNRLQAELLIRLKPDGRGVTVVDDDAQSIIAVGTPITGRPPHRSERARFGHSAPTLGIGRRSAQRATCEGCAAWGARHQPTLPCGPK